MPFAYPGVYIEEDLSPGLNILSSETAVPVFVFSGGFPIDSSELLQIDSWLDFLALLVDGVTDFEVFEADALYNSVKYYFINGGGRCYVSDYNSLGVNLLNNPGLITLVVEAGISRMEANDFFFGLLDDIRAAGCNVFALCDSLGGREELLTGSPVNDMAHCTSSDHAAVYGPWFTNSKGHYVPPSAIAAALIARTDNTRGVWKAPANIAVAGDLTLTLHFSKEVHGLYNVHIKPLNLFREFTGKGTLLWGARTLSLDTDRWRYVSVRRLFNMIEQDIEKAIRAMMFEPNNQPTWEKVRVAIENYLFPLWQNGAFQGAKPEEAFKVQVGEGETMSKADIYAGKLIVEIGINAVRPAEFIILRFTQNMESR